MEENRVVIEELAQEWNKLRFDIERKKKIEFAAFENVFIETYKLLSEISMDATIEKQYIGLIVNAFLFANSNTKDLDFRYLATMVLTERMLNCYVTNSTPATQGSVPVYILEARSDVQVDFNNVNESLAKLVRIFEEDYWKKW